MLEEALGMLHLVVRGLFEDGGDVLEALLPGDGGGERAAVPRLAFADKGLEQILGGLAVLPFHGNLMYVKG